MSDKKMTEEEIMNALECCYNAKCSECPYEIRCIKIMVKDALTLINRKNEEIEALQIKKEHLVVFLAEAKAEVERLKAIEEAHREQNGELRKEVERWRGECENQSTLWSKHFESIFETAKETAKETARAEAIKEFAERVKEESILTDKFGEVILVADIDQIAKEMGVEL